jgi:tetratricopeptide (TPR) repeat protein
MLTREALIAVAILATGPHGSWAQAEAEANDGRRGPSPGAQSFVWLDVVRPDSPIPRGSPAALIEGGWIVTAWHVLDTSTDAWVNLGDSTVPVTAVVAESELRDIIALAVDGPCEGVVPAPLADAIPEPCSDIVLFGPDDEGRIGPLIGFITSRSRDPILGDTFMTSVTAVPGQSGSPAFDERGRFVGCLTDGPGTGDDLESRCAGVSALAELLAQRREPVPIGEWRAQNTSEGRATARPLIRQGNNFQKIGRLDDAIAAYQQAHAADPTFAGGCFNLLRALIDGRRLDEARRLIAERKIDWPWYEAMATETEARILLAESKPDEVIKLVEAIPEAERNAADFAMLGSAFRATGQYRKAHEALAAAAEADEWDSWALLNLAQMLMHEGRTQDALEVIGRAKARDCGPGPIAVHSRLLFEVGRQDEAMSMLQAALEVHGPHPYLALILAWQHSALKDDAASDAVLRKALAVYPADIDLLEQAIRVAVRLKDLEHARGLLRVYRDAGGHGADQYAYVYGLAVEVADEPCAREVMEWLEPIDSTMATRLRAWQSP